MASGSDEGRACEQLSSDRRNTMAINLSRAPWWGGQFERIIGLMKQSMYKTIGNGFLSLEELREAIMTKNINHI